MMLNITLILFTVSCISCCFHLRLS